MDTPNQPLTIFLTPEEAAALVAKSAKPEAKKHDGAKPPLSLLPRSALVRVAEVLAFGAKKYDAHNWRKGMAWSRLYDAAMRHLTAHIDGETKDPESGLSHLAHAACCLCFLVTYEAEGLGTDDRYGN